MLIRCPKCGLVYSYVRNICHLCENHSIFFGAIFNGNRKEHQWNCDKNSISTELKQSFDDPNTKLNLEIDADIIFKERIDHKWNCICLSVENIT
jgi:hypothetical protein